MKAEIEHILPEHERFERSELRTSIPARFANVTARHAQRVAIDDGSLALSYASLDRESNRIAQTLLRDLGPQPEPLALLFEQGALFHIAQLGVLKAGKFYACLDTELRSEKQLEILSGLRPRAILCSADLESAARRLAEAIAGCVVIVTDDPHLARGDERPNVRVAPESYACIIYTSGSTGPPIGVILSHETVLHFAMNSTNAMHIRADDRASQLCPLSSAASVGETFPILLNGATLLPFPVKARGIRSLARWLIDAEVNVYTSVPTLFRMLLAAAPQQFPKVRLVRLSGDRILKKDFELFRKHFSEGCLFRATLGAAEACLYTQYYLQRSSELTRDVVPAGYALEDMEVFVVDDDLQRVAPGDVGEIAVRSRYLSAGYWNDDVRTSERFLPTEEPLARIYLTRDVGYLEKDGCLIHLGRKDARVKVYGKMVMLTDLEEALLELTYIENAVVVPVPNDHGDTALVAYYVGTEESASLEVLRCHLTARFPLEVVPKAFVRLDALPITDRNKIDRLALMYRGRALRLES